MNILIADDEEYARIEIEEVLERIIPDKKTKLFFAEDYDSAMSVIGDNRIDIAFLDIQMPGKNGLALAQNIKRASPETNIIMVTAYSQYALDALKRFVSGYLLKPVMERKGRRKRSFWHILSVLKGLLPQEETSVPMFLTNQMI